MISKVFKVFLAPMEKSHISRYMELSGDGDLIDTMGWRPFQPGEDERFLKAVEIVTLPSTRDRNPVTISIVAVEGNRPIGYVTLKGIDLAKGCAELGIAIMDQRYRSAGYGPDALCLAADYGFETLRLRVLGLTVFPSNTRAIRAYENAGFKGSGVLRNSWRMPDGQWRDMVAMELTRKDWRAWRLRRGTDGGRCAGIKQMENKQGTVFGHEH